MIGPAGLVGGDGQLCAHFEGKNSILGMKKGLSSLITTPTCSLCLLYSKSERC